MNEEEYTILAIAWSAVRAVLDRVGYVPNIKKAWTENRESTRKTIKTIIDRKIRENKNVRDFEKGASKCLDILVKLSDSQYSLSQIQHSQINGLSIGKCEELASLLYVLMELCEFPFLKKNLYLSVYDFNDHVFCLFHTGAVPEFSKDIKVFFNQIGMSGHTAVFADPWLSCACLVKPETTEIVLNQARDFGVDFFMKEE